MDRYDKRLELAPRDVVSRSIILESRRTGSDNFYLDIRYKGHDYLVNRFPGIYEGCLKHGVDMTKDLIPYSRASTTSWAESTLTLTRVLLFRECML